MATLDANHGHYGSNGVYHYHGSAAAPYMIGNMVGQVTEDNTMQIIPQPHANPVRPGTTPLSGAVITGCVPNGTGNGYTLTYTLSGQTHSVQYSWTPAGVYTFNFIDPSGTTTSHYNGFTPCTVPTSLETVANTDANISVYPNPTINALHIELGEGIQDKEVKGIEVLDSQGKSIYTLGHYESNLEVGHLAKGVYFVNIQMDKYRVTKKVVVK
jgi:hypothetical protein